MNERIREIAKQAYIADASKLPNWKFKPETEFLLKQLEGFNEKFAELIIRECMDQSNWIGKNNFIPTSPDNTAYAINLRIKEHFGVKE